MLSDSIASVFHYPLVVRRKGNRQGFDGMSKIYLEKDVPLQMPLKHNFLLDECQFFLHERIIPYNELYVTKLRVI